MRMDITTTAADPGRIALGAREIGTKVRGTYLGVPIEGTIKGVRRYTMDHRVWEFRVALAAPIMLHGHERDGNVLVYTDFHGAATLGGRWDPDILEVVA